jgi:hypothetical protein
MQDALIDVAPHDLNLPVAPPGAGFQQEDRDRIGLLSGRTPGAPDAQALLPGVPGAKLGEDLLGERLELSDFPKK